MALSRYRVVPGPSGAHYPDWVEDLDGASGVYVIRDSRNKSTLYVGESHTDRLRSTLTRHFQNWSGPTAGYVYERGAVEVAYELTESDYAEDRQAELIERLRPRDNVYLQDEGDDIPF